MEGEILNRKRELLGVLDVFESFIWVDRFRGFGDFEIYKPVSTSALQYLEVGNYLTTRNSNRHMIIEDREVVTNVESGNRLKVNGRSLESILDRRAIWNFTVLSGSLQNGIKKLLDENAINPSDPDRKIPGLVFRASNDPRITELTVEAQYHGENLYKTIFELCEVEELGFRVLPDSGTGYVFELYYGEDRSFESLTNNVVIFSPEFENLLESNYLETFRSFKNVALVGGEGEGADRKLVSTGSGSGLDRYETFVDANSVSSNLGTNEEGEEIIIPDNEYRALLAQRGEAALAELQVTKAFEGVIEAERQFVYGRDFFLGDIVRVENEYGLGDNPRITEIIQSQDETGYHMIPTFSYNNS